MALYGRLGHDITMASGGSTAYSHGDVPHLQVYLFSIVYSFFSLSLSSLMWDNQFIINVRLCVLLWDWIAVGPGRTETSVNTSLPHIVAHLSST